MNDEILEEQIHFCRYLINHDIPFMKLVETENHHPYCLVTWEGETYWFILHKWMEGIHIVSFTPSHAEKTGQMVRRIHDVSLCSKVRFSRRSPTWLVIAVSWNP